MSRRFVIWLIIPAAVLIIWLISAQLPRWTAPQPGWFVSDTPGVCAAVASLTLYDATRGSSGDAIGSEAARSRAAQVAAEYTGAEPLAVSEPLAVTATLPGDQRRAVYVVTVELAAAAPLETDAVIYLDAARGDPLRVIAATAAADGAAACAFDLRGAVVAAVKSPPLILLVIYTFGAALFVAVRWLLKARGTLQ